MENSLTTGEWAALHEQAVKPASWYTAFFYLAEHVRRATNGSINHKGLYALVGQEGRFINHINPTVRKRTAGALSRIIHTKRYADEMRATHLQDNSSFDRAATRICAAVRTAQHIDDVALLAWLAETCWPDIRCGLVNESAEWRKGLDVYRLDCEMSMLFLAQRENGVRAVSAEPTLSAMLYVIAYGHLQVRTSRALVDRLASSTSPVADQPDGNRACVGLVRFASPSLKGISGIWAMPANTPFIIGRYTDSHAIETSPEVSRAHCCIFQMGGSWHFEDLKSRNGSKVMRNGACVYDASSDCEKPPLPLEAGDVIELPGGSRYLFTTIDAEQVPGLI